MTDILASIPLLAWWATPLSVAVVGLIVVLTWWRQTRHLSWRTRAVLVAIGVAAGVGSWLAVDVWWRPFADGVGRYVWAWVGVLGFVAAQAIARPRRPDRSARRWWSRVLIAPLGVVVKVVAVFLAALLAINAHFSAYPSLAAALGVGYEVTSLGDVGRAVPQPSRQQRPDGPLVASWRPPLDMPAMGRIVSAPIPSGDPAFTPRDALVYLPPAYLTAQRPVLPVLVLLPGQPGSPQSWLTAGEIQKTMDGYAAAHAGLAPVVVMPDPLGVPTQNPLCSDANLGRVATYLQVDLPAWVEKSLQVDPDHRRWAIGGASNGGTCSLQVVTRAPTVYPTFLDMSGEFHPSLGSEERTIAKGFGGDRAAYLANDPLTLLQQGRYEGVHGVFSAGDSDPAFLDSMRALHQAAAAAGMTTELRVYPGTHAWTVFAHALNDQVGWLGDRLGITA